MIQRTQESAELTTAASCIIADTSLGQPSRETHGARSRCAPKKSAGPFPGGAGASPPSCTTEPRCPEFSLGCQRASGLLTAGSILSSAPGPSPPPGRRSSYLQAPPSAQSNQSGGGSSRDQPRPETLGHVIGIPAQGPPCVTHTLLSLRKSCSS